MCTKLRIMHVAVFFI